MQSLDGLDMHVELPFVVGSASSIEIAVADRRLEGRCFPEFEWVRRLNVVVPVQQHRRLSRRVKPIGIHQRMIGGRNHLDVFEFRSPHGVGNEGSRTLHIAFVLGQCADARDTKKSLQFLKQTVLTSTDERIDGLGHGDTFIIGRRSRAAYRRSGRFGRAGAGFTRESP